MGASILTRFGYTAREAVWLHHVLLHSGVFLRRQYLAHLGHEKPGAADQRLLARLIASGHATVRPYHRRERLYHLTGKALYEAVGEPDLRHRRPIPPHRLAQKLMLLDLTIQEPAAQWLATEHEKVRLFTERGIERDALPRRVYQASGPALDTERYFIDRFPIGVDQTGVLGVVYPDFSGHEDAFDQFMREHAALLIALPAAEVIYVTGHGGVLGRAPQVHQRHLGPHAGFDEALWVAFSLYCEARRGVESRWLSDEDRHAHQRALAQASRFRSQVYERLYQLFVGGNSAACVLAFYGARDERPPVGLRHVALPHRYYSMGFSPKPRPRRRVESVDFDASGRRQE